MSATTEIRCDACKADITYTAYAADYRIVVASQPKASQGSAVLGMTIRDPVPESLHFCDWECLTTHVQPFSDALRKTLSRLRAADTDLDAIDAIAAIAGWIEALRDGRLDALTALDLIRQTLPDESGSTHG